MFPVALLTGSALLAHNDSCYGKTRTETVTLAGYIHNGKASYTAYYENLLKAKIQRNAEETQARIGVERIIEAIKNREDYRKHNDKVVYNQITDCCRVYYHGNLIANVSFSLKVVQVFHQGWRTKSTKDRLNRILMHFCGVQLFQKNYTWTMRSGGYEEPFTEGMCLPMI